MLREVENTILRLCNKVFGRIYYLCKRKRLINHNFTILCSNCMGGILYQHLMEKFCSPTINLWMYETDFQKFCLSIEYYRKCKLNFIESEKKYPVAKIGDEGKEIKIFFLHYKSQQEASYKWNERMKRIDHNNLYVIATDNDNMTEKLLENWKDMKCKNLVVFTAREYPELSYTFALKKYSGKESIGKYVNDTNRYTGIRYVEKIFDFVNFFNK